MRFLYNQFQAKKWQIIEVDIDQSTKVKFMTALDFKYYKMGRTHNYYGGLFEAGTLRFVLPFDAVWYAVVEKGTYREPIPVRASCRLVPPDRDARSSVSLDAPAVAAIEAPRATNEETETESVDQDLKA
jgi:hypothetical protein